MRRLATSVVGFAAVAALVSAPAAAAPRAAELTSVKHVFVVVLENKDYEATFGASSPASYLSKTLPSQGQLLTQYFAIGHVSLDNYIAMISGQAPNPVTQSDCQVFQDFVPPAAVIDSNGQAIGQGCVYPAAVPTLANQMDQAGLTWRGYMQDMKTPCRHPAVGAQDSTQTAKVGDQYATRHNPFMYFHSIIDDNASCQSHVVDLSQLPNDLAASGSTPNFSFVTPDLCHDGHDKPCVNGEPGGLVSADAFLQEWVPKIVNSEAFKKDGLLVITFDEAEVGNPASATACCGEVPGPNSSSPGIVGPGGGRVGAVVLSPFVQPGTVNDTPYNHYSLLRTIEDVFGLPHLGFAASTGLRPFGSDVLNANASAPAAAAGPGTTAPGSLSPSSGGTTLPATGGSLPLLPGAAVALIALLALLGFRAGRAGRAGRV